MLRSWPRTHTAWTIFAAFLALAAALFLPLRAGGQQPGNAMPTPRLLLVTPCGGQTGSTFEVTVTGQDLDAPTGLHFSHPDIKAEPLGAGSPAKVVSMKGKKGGKAMTNAANQRFKVTVPADVPPGIHDVRVVGKWGISNPRAFVVGDLKEFVEREPNNDVPEGQRVEVNSTVTGVISAPTDVDYYLFHGQKGQRVVVSCLTSSIDSRLPAVIELYSSAGSSLASSRGYRENDALLDATLTEDGDYYVRVSSFTYTQGGADYFYRLTVTTAPWIDAVFPPMVEPGKSAQVTVYGRNLPGGKADSSAVVDGRVLEKITVTVEAPADAVAGQRLAYTGHVTPAASGLDGFELRLRNGAGVSNPMLLTYAHAPVVLENPANDTPENAQRLTLPCEVAGRFEKRNDRDWYVFHARKGDVYSIEGFAERLGSPLDLFLEVRKAGAANVLAELDDDPEILSLQLYTRSDDPPRYRFAAPADGDYLLQVGSRDGTMRWGPRHVYRVRITPERPDFRVIAMPPGANLPDAAVVHRGGHQLFNLVVWRQDGFNGEIAVTAEGLPPGVTLPPQVIPPGAKQGVLVVSAEPDAPAWAGTVRLAARAKVGGKELVREVRAATATWPTPQPNIPTLSRLDREVVLAVRDQAPFSLTAEGKRFAVLPGGKVTVPLTLKRLWPDLKGPVQLTALDATKNLTFRPLTLQPGKDRGEAVFDVKNNAIPGTYTVVLRGQAQAPFARDTKAKGKKANLNIVQPSTPITIRVLPKEVAKLTLSPGTVNVKRGGRTEVVVQVARLYDYEGDFKVQLILPPGTKGLSADKVIIPAGQNEARLVLRAAPDAATGPRPSLSVEAVALIDGTLPATHRAKLSISVGK